MLIIAESLIEPRFDDPIKEAEHIVRRIEKRLTYKRDFDSIITNNKENTMRLRYTKSETGMWNSTRNVLGNSTSYSVTINADYSYFIIDTKTLGSVVTGTSLTFTEAKRNVRNAFTTTLGVNLGTETRLRRVAEKALAAKVA